MATVNINVEERRLEAQRKRLRDIYAAVYKDITIDIILDKYEAYCNWCRDHKVFPKTLTDWGTYNQSYPPPILDKIRNFVQDIDL